jgi:hypothetical protein
MAKSSRGARNADGHPPEIQEFIDWQEHQYMGSAYYHGRRVPPLAVMRSMLFSQAGVVAIFGLLLAAAVVVSVLDLASDVLTYPTLAILVLGTVLLAIAFARGRRLR